MPQSVLVNTEPLPLSPPVLNIPFLTYLHLRGQNDYTRAKECLKFTLGEMNWQSRQQQSWVKGLSLCETEQTKETLKWTAVHKSPLWTISSNKEWFSNQGGFHLRKVFSYVFSQGGQPRYRPWCSIWHCPRRKRSPSNSALTEGLGFSCRRWVPGEETEGRTPGYKNNGFFSPEFCGHFITLYIFPCESH